MLTDKTEHLKRVLLDMGTLLVAFSGGIDSTFLLKTAVDTLGRERVLAVTAVSETYPPEELSNAGHLAGLLNARHITLFTEELRDSRFSENPPERCYYCKTELFSKLLKIAGEQGIAFVADGANSDDLRDFRPGMKAGRELGVRSPLQEAGLTKEEIRLLSRQMGLPNWNKPSMPCLSSRFPYGHKITEEKLRQVEEAERFIRSMGLDDLRVRHHGDMARIEVPESMLNKIASPPWREKIVDKLKSLGFHYITLDLQGFRSGSMNETLPKEILNG